MRRGRPPGGYSRYVDYLDIYDSWCPVTRLAQELGVTDLTAKRAMNRLRVAGRVELRQADRGQEARSKGKVNV